jgi:rare lipoprotein A
MTSKAFAICAFAGTILATTVGTANSTTLHAGYRAHHWHGRAATLSAHQRVAQRSSVAHVRHNDDSAGVAGSAAGGSAGGLMSGIASVYSGERTANGEFAAAGGLTAAHRTLPFGTMVKVTNQSTGKSVVVRINDRGPFVRGRVIDLTPAGARAIGVDGIGPVTLSVVSRS